MAGDSIEDILIYDGKTLPLLADPVIAEIFKNADLAGQAMFELINATLEDSGDELISEIIDLVPQRVAPSAQDRGYRIDVLSRTVRNEFIIFEVQLSHLLITNERALVYSDQALSNNTKQGQTWREIAKVMPRVLVVNILNFDLRKQGVNFHQIGEFTYREEPRELASNMITLHNIQLPRYRNIVPNLSKPLHCWLTAICRAQDNNLSLKEVVGMDAQLSGYAQK
ncbi:MAG: Rpn family recombination-promoting nuclease/putative transposase, partial [Oscillospiraceae bacterium]|nr:Rpn family recombination-promoting nuclease/putative transposase [Oscillospiraceae bacterium]